MTDGKLLTCHKTLTSALQEVGLTGIEEQISDGKETKNNTVFWDRQSLALFLSLNTVSISFTMQFYFLSSPIVDECPSKRILHTRAFTNVSDSCRLHSFASERPLQCFAPKRVGTRNVEERAEFYSQDTHELELASN